MAKYTISQKEIGTMDGDELVREYLLLRERTATPGKWNANYLGAMEDRKAQIGVKLADRFVEEFTKKETEGEGK